VGGAEPLHYGCPSGAASAAAAPLGHAPPTSGSACAQVWDWVDGVLTAGLFESDVDETGNIMMYNQLVGAVRLRQMRVSNTSCFLSENVQRRVEVTRGTDTYTWHARHARARCTWRAAGRAAGAC
jgi:hypothetical protein